MSDHDYSALPGLGPRNNQTVFYTVSVIVMLNFFLIIAITSYGASLGVNMQTTLGDVTEIVSQLNDVVPKANAAMDIYRKLCANEDFFRNYGYICN